ncbi:hypothetical protein PBY51_002708 [Eleginops maclovinus]|uniref:Uncharacterized protein n=2 Tax=Eleginops maclovinus TaxID=56733 RepID=A0AAN7XCS2_ELEMC|nr:hypothetical protein PBY51_002708 [Eleginops maclovinus]
MIPAVTTVKTSKTKSLRADPPSCLPGLPMALPSLTPDTFSDPFLSPSLPSDSDDISISSASTPCSPDSPF